MENLMHPSILFLYLLITFLTFSATQRCPLSDRTVETVKKCPEDEESTNTSARIKQCEKLANIQTCSSPSKFKYHCLPTDLSGTLVEVCAVERYIYGICVLYNNTEIQTNESINCSQSSRCPKRFLSSEAHLYEPCSPNDLTTIQFFDTTVTFVPEDEAKVHSVVLFAATGIIFLGIIIGFFFIKIVKWRKRRQTNRYGPKETEEIMLENGENMH
ncbi:uncharacterized protein LOC134256381 [Saccostrea cucullata]|uniref:uncharacterized protein LOC134256381 n=1 Tax=Saccostrea cuccullata TaxID=36930 RepID=UPI002ED36E9B